MRVNKGMIPPGGWHFPEGPGHTIRTDTYETLIDEIFKHRLRVGKSTASIEAEVARYFCTRWPSACVNDPIAVGPDDTPSRRVARSAARLAAAQPAGGYDLVNQGIAAERAAVCGACPAQVAWKTGCSSCSASTAALLLQLRKLRNTPSDGKLMACKHAGWENQTAVHLPETVVKPTPEEKETLPEACWRRKIP